MAPHEDHASSMEARRKEGSNAVGSGMHVLFRLHESRRGHSPRRSRVRWEGSPVLGGRPAGGCIQSQVDQSADKRVQDGQIKSSEAVA